MGYGNGCDPLLVGNVTNVDGTMLVLVIAISNMKLTKMIRITVVITDMRRFQGFPTPRVTSTAE
jgi:hypothetical protein